MLLYARHIVEQVLNSTDIVQLVSTYCELKPAGSDRYKALCPFHTEKTPSFIVSKSRQIYHCFGCGKGGDAISFLMEMQNVSFSEALETLADSAGIRLPRYNDSSKEYSAGQDERKTVFQIVELAANFYRNQLVKSLTGKLAQEYLNRRNLSTEIQEKFKIGFAPPDGYSLFRFLKSKGFSERLMLKTGLIRSGEGRYYDFFRNRILFPIRNIEGKIISFGGRDITGEGPKYINLAETEIYQKSRTLYGLWEGKEAIRSQKSAILVEGYIDLLRCFQSGIQNVVATCGTSLTFEQAKLIRRFVPGVVIVYDGDSAGLAAALRATGILLQVGLTVYAVTLPEGKDPDDFLQSHSVSEWEELIRNAPSFFTFYLQQNQHLLSTPQGKVSILSELFRLISMMGESSIKEEFLKEIATALRLSYWAVKSDYEQFLKEGYAADDKVYSLKPNNVSIDDIDFLHSLLDNEQIKEEARKLFKEIPFPETPFGIAIKYILENNSPDPRFIEDEEARNVLQKVFLSEPVTKDLSLLATERLNRFLRDYLNQQISDIQQKIRIAEKNREKGILLELLETQSKLILKRNNLTHI